MLEDKVGYVADIFRAQVPYIGYNVLPSRSIRNMLLAHYIIESLPPYAVMEVLEKDTGKDCVPKLALADDTLFFTRRGVVYLDKKEGDETRTGTPYPASSLDKFAMICGLRLYRAIYGNGKNAKEDIKDGIEENAEPDQKSTGHKKHNLELLTHPAFKGISDGADPEHAAACYLGFFLPKGNNPYESRIAIAQSVSDLRRILGFKVYHERTVLQHLRDENLSELSNPENTMDEVFLNAVLNWNKDILLRFDRRGK